MKVIIYYYNTDKAKQGYQFVNDSNLSIQEKTLMEEVMKKMGGTGKPIEKQDKEGISVRYEPVQVNDETKYFFCAIFRPKSNRGSYSRGYIQYVGFLLDGKEADELFSHPYSALERVMRQEAGELLDGKEQQDAFQRITEKLKTATQHSPELSPPTVSENAMRALYIGATYTTQSDYQTVFYEAEAEEQIRSLEHLFQELPIPLRKTVSFFRNALDLGEVFGAALCFFRLPKDDVPVGRGAYRTNYNFRRDSLNVPLQAANQDTVKVWLDGEYAQDIRKQTREYFRACDWNGYTIKNMWAYYAKLSAALALEDRNEWERQVLDVVGEDNFRITVTERKILYPLGPEIPPPEPENAPSEPENGDSTPNDGPINSQDDNKPQPQDSEPPVPEKPTPDNSISVTPNAYTVNFINQNELYPPKQVNSGQTVSPPSLPFREGLHFKEWQLGGKPYNFQTPVTKNITLSAIWEKDPCYVVFESDGDNRKEVLVPYETPVTEPQEKPTKEGYDFIGWQLDGSPYDFTEPVTRDIALKAAWRQKPSQKPSQKAPREKRWGGRIMIIASVCFALLIAAIVWREYDSWVTEPIEARLVSSTNSGEGDGPGISIQNSDYTAEFAENGDLKSLSGHIVMEGSYNTQGENFMSGLVYLRGRGAQDSQPYNLEGTLWNCSMKVERRTENDESHKAKVIQQDTRRHIFAFGNMKFTPITSTGDRDEAKKVLEYSVWCKDIYMSWTENGEDEKIEGVFSFGDSKLKEHDIRGNDDVMALENITLEIEANLKTLHIIDEETSQPAQIVYLSHMADVSDVQSFFSLIIVAVLALLLGVCLTQSFIGARGTKSPSTPSQGNGEKNHS